MRGARHEWPMVGRRQILHEARAVVAGQAFQRYKSFGLSPPAWALVNGVAHGDRDALLPLARSAHRRHALVWEQAIGAIAVRLLAATETDEALHHLQQVVLSPMELALLRDADRAPRSPWQLAESINAALDHAAG